MIGGEVLGRAVVQIGSDIEELKAGLALASAMMEKSGKEMSELGQELSLKVTAPLVLLGTAAVHAFGQSEEAMAHVRTAIESTGGAAGVSAEHIFEMADALRKTTTFGDEATKSAAALMLTFTNVRNEVGAGNQIFDRAIIATQGLASAMGTDLSTAAFQIGRALEDPAHGFMMLRRAGILFSEAEKAQIKIAAEHGDVLKAQTLILARVERASKTATAEMVKTPFGQLKQAWNEIDEVLEQVGQQISIVLLPLVAAMKSLAEVMQEINPQMLAIIVATGALVAAIGPALIAFAALQKIWAALGVVHMGLLPTLGLIVLALGSLAAAGVAVVQNWVWIKIQALSLWTAIKDVFYAGVEGVLSAIEFLTKPIALFGRIAQAVPGFKVLGDAMVGLGAAAGTMNTDVQAAHESMLADAGKKLGTLSAEYDAIIAGMVRAAQKAKEPIGAGTAREPVWLGAVIAARNALDNALAAADEMGRVMGKSFDIGAVKAAAIETAIKTMVDEMTKGGASAREIAEQLGNLRNSLQVEQLASLLTSANTALDDAATSSDILGKQFHRTGAEAKAYDTLIQGLINAHLDMNQVVAGTNLTLKEFLAILLQIKLELSFAEQQAKTLEDAWYDMANKGLDYVTDFVTGARESFAEFVRDVLKDIAKLLLRLAILQGIHSLFPKLNLGPLQGHADGGFIGAGDLGLVGERGPELVSGGRSGLTVYPSARVSAAGGNKTHNTFEVSISAVDARSFSDLIEANPGAITAPIMRELRRSDALRGALMR